MKAVCAAACVGIAAWCSLGALGIAGDSSVSARIALLPPWWLIAVLIGAAWIVVRVLRLSPAELSPLFTSALLILPWLPIPLPAAALLWTGGLIPVVWMGVAIGVVLVRCPPVRRRWIADPTRAPIVVLTISAVLYGYTAWWLSPRLPAGDEPHYLVITQSLLEDGDLRIENNHQRGDYLEYFSGVLKPDYLRRGTDGAIYSIHAPGLPLLVLPAYWVWGYAGTLAFLALVAAWGTALTWRVAYATTGSSSASWFGWACCAITTPFLFLATEVFPDGIGATVLLLGLLPVLQGRPTGRSWAASSIALATLPWLHTRFAVLAGVAGMLIAIRLRTVRRIGAFLIVPAISAAAWFGYFFMIYGTVNPSAPYGHYTQTAVANLARGLPGLFFDQQFGLVANAPVYAVVLAGLIWNALHGRRWTWPIAAVALPYVAAVGMFQMWWGGTSVPARFLTPLCLVLGVAAARIWHEARVPVTRAAAISLLAVSVFISTNLLIPGHGRLLFNFRDGFALWLEWANDLVDLPRALPSLFRDTPLQAWLKAGVWVASAAAAWILLRAVISRAADQRAVMRRLAWVLPWCLAGCAMLASSLVWQVARVQPVTPATATQALVMEANPRFRPVAYDYATGRFEMPRLRLSRVRLQPSTRRPIPAGAPLLTVPQVPAGSHQLHLLTSQPADGTIVLRVGRNSPPLDTWQLAEARRGPLSRLIRFPVEVQSLYVEADERARQAITGISLQPWVMEDLRTPVASGIANRAARYGAVSVYFLSSGAFPEPQGFWLEGGSQARVVISNYGAPLRVFLRNAPVENTIAVEVDGDRREAGLHPGEETTLVISRKRTTADVLVEFQTTHGFRPSEREAGSTDVRYLGCWVEIR
jgi:hypothetical protein